MLDIRLAKDRGLANFGWLKSRHTFSFGSYYDPEHNGFSDLLVINDDQVDPDCGFDTHGHQDMEIFSYVLEGALAHQDSMKNGSVMKPGDVQLMSAGTGVRHSEFNASRQDNVHFLQIWIVPGKKGVAPSYQQQHFAESEKRGQLRLIISPNGSDESLSIHQDVYVYAGLFDGQESATFTVPENRFSYVHIARGKIQLNEQTLHAGDGVKIRTSETLRFSHGQDAEILVFNMRPIEHPSL